MSKTITSANRLSKTALPFLTGFAASAPVSSGPRTAVPLLATATRLPRPVDWNGSRGAPNILTALRRPLVGPFAHVRRRGYGIDSDDLIQSIGDIGHRFVCIHGLKLAFHDERPASSCK